MAQIAGFRGVLWNTSKVELGKVSEPGEGAGERRLSPVSEPGEAASAGERRLSPVTELERDPTRAMYRYHQTFRAGPRSLVRKSWFAAIALAPWTDGVVRAHEATDPKQREAALAEIAASGIHTDAVLAGYRDAPGEVDRLFKRVESDRPVVDVTTPDGTNHKLWRVGSAEMIGKLRTLFAPKKLHVLDGHARYEAMVAYRDQLAAKGPINQYSSANHGLACLVNVDDPALAVGARHRIVRSPTQPDGTRVTRDAALDKAKTYFIIEKLSGAARDVAKQLAALAETVAHQPAFVAVFAGDPDAWKLTLSPDISPVAEGVSIHRAIQKYDPVVVEHLFLAKLAPGLVTETALDPAAVVAAVQGGADLGLVLRPLTVDQITHADELGALLPAGSSAFHPPVARLLAYVVDPDEDVV